MINNPAVSQLGWSHAITQVPAGRVFVISGRQPTVPAEHHSDEIMRYPREFTMAEEHALASTDPESHFWSLAGQSRDPSFALGTVNSASGATIRGSLDSL